MDIYEYLEKDHKKVAKLFSLYEKTNNQFYKIEIVDRIIEELSVHATAEEETFYKVLENYTDIFKDIKHSEKEHAEIFLQMKKLMSPQAIDQSYDELVLSLKKLVEHHVDEEENKIFKEAKKVLSDAEAMKIKFQMHDFKEKIMNGLTEEMMDDLTVF